MLCRTKGVHAGLGFLYHEGGSLLTGVSRHGDLCCRAGCHPDERSRNSFLIDRFNFLLGQTAEISTSPLSGCGTGSFKLVPFKVSEL